MEELFSRGGVDRVVDNHLPHLYLQEFLLLMGHLLSLGIYANVVLVPCCTPHSWRPTYPVLLNSFLDDL